MKTFLIHTLKFFIPLLILLIPLDYVLSYYLSQSNEYPGEIEVWNDIYQSKATCDVAVYGSSRAWAHINPEILKDSLHSEVYNFGMDGHNFWLQYLRHLEFLKHHPQPKTIILSVDVFTLQKRTELYQQSQFLPYMLWNANIRKYTSSYVGFKKSDYYIPLLRYSGKTTSLKTILKNAFTKQSEEKYRKRGFLGLDRAWNFDFEKAKAANVTYQIKMDSATLVLFENFIQECRNTKTELIFVYTPEYIEGQKLFVNRSELMSYYKSISEKYAIPFYDYSGDSLCLDKKYFYNASHLNKQGAEIFSRKLASDLKARTKN